MELDCHYCLSGRGLLVDGEYVCNNCGTVFETPEENTSIHPYHQKITNAESDTPDTLSRVRAKDIRKHFQEEMKGNKTVVVKLEKKKRRQSHIDHKAAKIKSEQRDKIKFAIVNMTEKLGLPSNPVLDRFDPTYLRKIRVDDILKSNNIMTNKGHKRTPNVIAGYVIYKVFRNKVTVRQLYKVGEFGHESFRRMIKFFG